MLHKLAKLHPLISVTATSYIYILSGLIVNFLQLLIFVFIRTVSEKWGTKLNGYLQASHVAIFTFAVEWHCKCNIRFFYDPDDLKHINKEHTLCIANHRGEVDWLLGYTLLERLNSLKGCKGLIKKEAKYLPVVGWLMWFTDYIFLSRNWDQDRSVIAKTCGIWANYDPVENSNFYVLYAEGTRFTEAKHEASLKFCSERGITPFRNVLYPRTKGATEVISQLGESLGSVQNVVFGFPGTNTPDIGTMFAGKSTNIDIYFRRVGAEKIPRHDKDAIADYVVQQFREKDDLLEYHKKHNRFPGNHYPLPKRKRSLIMYYVWGALTILPSIAFLWYLVVNQSYRLLYCIALCFVLGGLAANKIISAAILSKSSSYGTEKQSSSYGTEKQTSSYGTEKHKSS